jgi:hypothetical protein
MVIPPVREQEIPQSIPSPQECVGKVSAFSTLQLVLPAMQAVTPSAFNAAKCAIYGPEAAHMRKQQCSAGAPVPVLSILPSYIAVTFPEPYSAGNLLQGGSAGAVVHAPKHAAGMHASRALVSGECLT